jgi:hypothetical protein
MAVRPRNGINAGKGFVEQHEPWPRRQGSRYLHPAPFSAGQANAHLVSEVGNSKVFHQQAQRFLACFAAHAFANFKDGEDVVPHGQLAKY